MSGKNLVRKTFLGDGSWTCPAGVTQVKVLTSIRNYRPLSGPGVLQDTGEMYTWGFATQGNLGNGTNTPSVSSPVLVTGGIQWQCIATTFSEHSLAIAQNGDMYSWGRNNFGQLGDASIVAKSSPVIVSGGLKWRHCATCQENSIGLAVNGDAYVWGGPVTSPLGSGVNNSSTPTLVVGGLKFTQVGTSDNCFFGITVNGDLYSWGGPTNAAGNPILGNGTAISSSPTIVSGGIKWQSIYNQADTTNSGQNAVVAVDIYGNAYAWGGNNFGQLGVGDITVRSTPTLVLGSLKWKAATSGGGYMVGIAADGSAYAWGQNGSGQLGLGDVVSRSSPVAVLGGLKWFYIGAYSGSNTTTAVSSAGRTYSWGANPGDGTNVPKSSPVIVVGGTTRLALSTEYVQVNAQVFNVTPGVVYPVNVFTDNPNFNYNATYVTNNAFVVDLEYFA